MTFCHGCGMGWVSHNLPALTDEDSVLSKPLTMKEVTVVETMICLGGLVATPFFGWTSDRFGRKTTGLLGSIPYLLSWFLKITFKSANGIIAARFFAGVGGAAVFIASATYCVEIATVNTRGVMGSLMGFFLNLGIVVTYAMGSYFSYDTVLRIMIAVPVVFIVLMVKMPETPAFLINRGRETQALEAIAWLRKVPKENPLALEELDELKLNIQMTQSTIRGDDQTNANRISSWKYLFMVKSTRRAFIICFKMLSVQGFLGIFIIIMYSGDIFKLSEKLPYNMSSIIVGSIQLIGSLTCLLLIEKTGRKVLLIWSCGINSLTMLTIGFHLYSVHLGYGVTTTSWIQITAVSMMVLTYSMGIGTIPFILPSELIPVQARSLASCLILIWMWLASFLTAIFFSYFVRLVGIYTLFWFFSCSGIIGIVVTILFLPETKGRSFEYIRSYYEGKKNGENELLF